MSDAPTTFQVLSVDDHASIRALIAELLESPGVNVVEAEGRTAALEALKASAPDVILLDIVYDREASSGYDLCKEFKALAPTVPIIGLSARSRPVDRGIMLEAGASGYLSKSDLTQDETAGRLKLIDAIEAICPKARGLWTK